MTDANKIAFEPFVTISLAQRGRQPYQITGATGIALVSNCPGVTAIHWYDAATARRLVTDLQALIAKLDPEPIVTNKILGVAQRKRILRTIAQKRKAKRK